ncbi:glycine cleavage system protein R [Reinekea thalattae]|uniref:Glycine cleavage system transcriptional repressor n=1 Tax=Reinekea thalattae TaxID=2593301 RepID=A0A5C8Z564_9GAMM|nr:ACT domain-containing protein [Reinekea thalattae]TXR53255.1 glycine cleavage system protein R [Reinekea thalattae]
MELILTILADDKPGITEKLAAVIEQHQGNWLESRLARMAGKFAGIVRVQVATNEAAALQTALLPLKQEGLSIQVEAADSVADDTLSNLTIQVVEVVGNDRPGIVRQVTNVLASIGANLIDIKTEIEPASMSGGNLFKALIKFTLQDEQNLIQITDALEALSPDLMVDTDQR